MYFVGVQIGDYLDFFYSVKGPSWGPQGNWGPGAQHRVEIYEFSRLEIVVRKYKKLFISEIV